MQILGQPAATPFDKKQQLFEIILPSWRPQKSAFAPHELAQTATLTEPKQLIPLIEIILTRSPEYREGLKVSNVWFVCVRVHARVHVHVRVHVREHVRLSERVCVRVHG